MYAVPMLPTAHCASHALRAFLCTLRPPQASTDSKRAQETSFSQKSKAQQRAAWTQGQRSLRLLIPVLRWGISD